MFKEQESEWPRPLPQKTAHSVPLSVWTGLLSMCRPERGLQTFAQEELAHVSWGEQDVSMMSSCPQDILW